MAKRKQPGRRAAIVDDPENAGVEGADDDTATKAWKAWKDSRTHLSDWRQEAREAYDFIAGRQYSDEEEATLKAQNRPVVVFNRTAVVLDAVSGYEINGRQDVTYQPRENEDTGGAEVESAGARYFREQCDAEDEESDAFYDLLATGYGWTEHRMDYDDDPEGMLKVERVDVIEMGYDPAATKRNLSDRRWDIRGKWWDKEVAKAKFPDADFDSTVAGDVEDDDGGQTPVKREAAAFYKDTGAGEQNDRRRGKVFILEYTWFEHQPFTSFIDPTSGKMTDTTPAKLKAMNDQLAAMATQAGGTPKPLRSVKRTKKVFKRAFVHGKETIDEGDAPCPDRFHYQAMTGKRDRNKNVFFGLVRPMKDPQRWANKFFSQYMHILNANAKGGMLHENGAFDDVKKIEAQLAKPGWRIGVNDGYMEKVRLVEPPGIPNDAMNMTQFAIGSTRDVTGVNVELLGMADRDQPGILEHARKQSAMAILAPFFNAKRRYHKEAGRLTLYFMGEYLSDGRLVRVVGQGKAQYVPLTKERDFTKFDVVVDEAPSSPNAKQAVFAVLMQVLPSLMKEGMPIPPDLLDYVPDLPAELAQKWKALLPDPANPNPQKQAQQALEMEEKKAVIEEKHSHSLLYEAQAGGEVAKMAGMLQQVLVGLSEVQAMMTGQPPPQMMPPAQGQAAPPGAPMPSPGPPPGPPPGAPLPPMPPPAPNVGAPPMVPNA